MMLGKGGLDDGQASLVFPVTNRTTVEIRIETGRFGISWKILYTQKEMKRNRILTSAVTLALGVFLSACSFTPAFWKETGPPTSHTLTRVGDSAYRIDLQGLASTTRHGVRLHLLKRAASVTLEEGYDYFIVSGGEVRGENEIQSTPVAGSYPESPSGSMVEGSARLSQRYSGSVLFHVFKGEKPPDNPLAFDAKEFYR